MRSVEARLRWVLVSLLVAGCSSSGGRGDDLGGGGARDLAGMRGGDDLGGGDLGSGDLGGGDLGAVDLGGLMDLSGNVDGNFANDFAVNDAAGGDLGLKDFAGADSAPSDLASGDLANPPTDFARPPADLTSSRPPCLRGNGFAAFRFHYSQNSGTNAIVDAFGLPDNSNWEAVPVYPTSYTDTNFGGGIEIGSGNWILIRYSVVGLTQINAATFSVYGRSYDVSASGSFDAWSPLYGDDAAPTDSMSVYPYAWQSVDYTGHVQVGDDPGLTGIRLYSGPSSGDIIVNTVELCIDGQ
jgi:hypothetical protein